MKFGFHKMQGISPVVEDVLLKKDSAPGGLFVGLLGN